MFVDDHCKHHTKRSSYDGIPGGAGRSGRNSKLEATVISIANRFNLLSDNKIAHDNTINAILSRTKGIHTVKGRRIGKDAKR